MPYTFMVIERGIQFLGLFKTEHVNAKRHLLPTKSPCLRIVLHWQFSRFANLTAFM